jgi:hypothetical protein
MFTDPLVLNLTGDTISLAVIPSSSNNSIRKGTTLAGEVPVQLTLGASPSRENPAAGGSVRHLIRTDLPVLDVDGKNIGNASCITVIVRPNNGANVTQMVRDAVQTNVSFLLGETDGSLDAAAAVDSSTLDRFINGEG